MGGLKVVALCSGGKDSCYSMQLCKQHGHEIVALANLLPEETAPDELDSFMFQTVGHQVIGAYATCMGIPLFRKHISGSSSLQDLGYTPTEGDEVEDLYLLLAYVKECMPGIQAVASGAIASDYQRLRVENVCSRLNLVSLAYLWHQPQRMLLRGMVESGMEAILVKVACLGLQPHKHLGRTIAALEPHLLNLADMYGCNVCGEGGEYESLTLDCQLFTRGRIVLDKTEVVHASGGVGHLVPTEFHVVAKAPPAPAAAATSPRSSLDVDPQAAGDPQQQQQQAAQVLPAPDIRQVPADYVPAPRRGGSSGGGRGMPCALPSGGGKDGAAAAAAVVVGTPPQTATHGGLSGLLSPRSKDRDRDRDAARGQDEHEDEGGALGAASPGSAGDPLLPLMSPPSFGVHVVLVTGPDYVQLVCRALRTREALASDVTEMDTTAALDALLAVAKQELALQHLDLHHCLFVHLFLSNMGHFQAANGVYCKHFPARDPPSRACVQVCLPPDCPVMCEFLLARGSAPPPARVPARAGPPPPVVRHTRHVLHVQSISSWAPSCIGPYSQATSYRGLVYLAGVIPLDPPNMTLVAGDITAQVLRAMASCEAVAVAQRSTVVGAALGLTVYLAMAAGSSAAAGGAGGGCAGGGERGSGGGAEARALARSAVEALLEHGLPGCHPPAGFSRSSGPVSTSAGGAASSPLPGQGRVNRSNTFSSSSTPATSTGVSTGALSGSGGGYGRRVMLGADGLDEEEEEQLRQQEQEGGAPGGGVVLDPYLQPPEVRCPVRPSVLYVVVPALPRGSMVEIQVVCLDVEALSIIRRLTAAQESLAKRRNLSSVDTPSLAHQQHHGQRHDGSGGSHRNSSTLTASVSHKHLQPASMSPAPVAAPSPGGYTSTWSEFPHTPRASMESSFSSAATPQRTSTHGSNTLPWQVSTDPAAAVPDAHAAGKARGAGGRSGGGAGGLGVLGSPERAPEAGGASAGGTPANSGPLMRQSSSRVLQHQRSSGLSQHSGPAAALAGAGDGERSSGSSDGRGSGRHGGAAPPAAAAPAAMPLAPLLPTTGSLPPSAFVGIPGPAGAGAPAPAAAPPPPMRSRTSFTGTMREAIAASAAAHGPGGRVSFSGSSGSSGAQPFQRNSLDGSILSFEVCCGSARAGAGGGLLYSSTGPSTATGMSPGLSHPGASPLHLPLPHHAFAPASAPGAPLPGPLGNRGAYTSSAPTSLDASAGAGAGAAARAAAAAGGPHAHKPHLPPSLQVGGDASSHAPAPRSPFERATAAAATAAEAAANPQAGTSLASPPTGQPSPPSAHLHAAAGSSASGGAPGAVQSYSSVSGPGARGAGGGVPPALSAQLPPVAVPAITMPTAQPMPAIPPGSAHAHHFGAPPSPLPPQSATPQPTVPPVAAVSPAPPAVPPAAAPSLPPGANDVMVTSVCCYGQVLRSIFHLPPSVFAPGVTSVQLTRRFRRAAASVLAAHGMDMSCLIWARVWYEKTAFTLTDDEFGYCMRPAKGGTRVLHVMESDEEDEEDEGQGGRGGARGGAPREQLGGVEEGEEDGAVLVDGDLAEGAREAEAARLGAASHGVQAHRHPHTHAHHGSPRHAQHGSPRAARRSSPHVRRLSHEAHARHANLGGGGAQPAAGAAAADADDPPCPSPPSSPRMGVSPAGGPPNFARQTCPVGVLEGRSGHSPVHHPHAHHGHDAHHHVRAHGSPGRVHLASEARHRPQHAQHGAPHGAGAPHSPLGQQHFHVSWVPVQRVMTNANPAPAQCVGVLELLAALPMS